MNGAGGKSSVTPPASICEQLQGELACEAEFGLSEFVAPATEVAVGAEREPDEALGGEHAREYGHLPVVDNHLAQTAEACVRSGAQRAADERGDFRRRPVHGR